MSFPITITARIKDNGEIYKALDVIAKKWGDLERKLFVEVYARGGLTPDEKNKLKRDWLAKENITSMQFNALDRQLAGKIAANKECLELSKNALKTKIARVVAELGSKELKNKVSVLHQKKRRKYNLEQKLKRLEARNPASLCFGTREYFRKQFNLEANKIKNLAEWKEGWVKRRNSQFLCLGIAAAKGGNFSCQITEVEETPRGLKGILNVRPFAGLPEVKIPIEFTYNTGHLLSALKEKRAITYRFCRSEDNKKWLVHTSVDRASVPIVTNRENGYLGVDLNKLHLACARINNDGNLVELFDFRFGFTEKGKYQTGGHRKNLIDITVKKLIEKALKLGTPIVIEKLDFAEKKKELKSRGYNKMLSSFAYSTFNKSLHSCAQRFGVEVIEVNPSCSSIIGHYKFGLGMGLTTHQAAAYCIARRGETTFTEHKRIELTDRGEKKEKTFYVPHVKFSERLKVYPSRNPQSVPERIHLCHVWKDWRKFPSIVKRKEKANPAGNRRGKSGRFSKENVTAQDEDLTDCLRTDYVGEELHPISGTTPNKGKDVVNCEKPHAGKVVDLAPSQEAALEIFNSHSHAN